MGNHTSQVVDVFQKVEGVATTVLEAVNFLSKIVPMVQVEHKSNGGTLSKCHPVKLGASADDATKNVTELKKLLGTYLQNSWKDNFGYVNDSRDNVDPTPPYLKAGATPISANDMACDNESNIIQTYKANWYASLDRFKLDTSQLDAMFTEVWGQVKTQSAELQYAITARSYPITSTTHKDKSYYIDVAGTGAVIKTSNVPLFLLGFEIVLYEAYDPMSLKKLRAN